MGTAEELAQSSAAILTEVRAGKITIHDAQEMFQLFETQRRVIETQEFDARLLAAEQGNVPPGVQ
jgi:primosomal protein N''